MGGKRGSRQYHRLPLPQVDDPDQPVQLGMWVRARTRRKAHALAAALGIPQGEYIRRLIEGTITPVLDEPDEMVQISAYVPAATRLAVRTAAKDAGVSLSEYVERLIDRA
jgi:cobalamin biosynthesis protein CbiD